MRKQEYQVDITIERSKNTKILTGLEEVYFFPEVSQERLEEIVPSSNAKTAM